MMFIFVFAQENILPQHTTALEGYFHWMLQML